MATLYASHSSQRRTDMAEEIGVLRYPNSAIWVLHDAGDMQLRV